MSKLNWSKLQRQSKEQSFRNNTESSYATSTFYKDNNIWHLRGKHFGTHIHKLPLEYLGWIIDNNLGSQYKEIAESELYRRFHELSNT